MPPRERKLERLTGRAAREIVRRGSAGEHNAVVLHVRGGERLILQRRVTGVRLPGDVFRFAEVEVLDG